MDFKLPGRKINVHLPSAEVMGSLGIRESGTKSKCPIFCSTSKQRRLCHVYDVCNPKFQNFQAVPVNSPCLNGEGANKCTHHSKFP